MADFDPQQPSDNESKDTAPAQPARRQWEYSGSCGDSCGCEGKREGRRDDGRDGETDSFVSDWSGAEKSLEEQAASFEARQSEMADAERMESAPPRPETFWGDLVRSQVGPQTAASTALARQVDIEAKGVQSETFWADLVRSQSTGSSGSASTSDDSARVVSSLTDRPTGMGWADDEASEWAPPQREYEPVQPAGEPLEGESGSDVAWSTPVSAQDDWETARSEGMSFESAGGSRPSLMAAAVEAAKAVKQPKEKKAKATKAAKPVAKKVKAKKPATKAKKPAAKAKKPAAKKVVKKATPAPKITKAPTRRAA